MRACAHTHTHTHTHRSTYTHNEMLFSLNNEGDMAVCLNLEDIMLSEINQTQKEKGCMISLIFRI